jgi:hypothetical protein
MWWCYTQFSVALGDYPAGAERGDWGGAYGVPFLSENASAMKKMMAGMDIKPSGDVEL